MSSLNLVLLPRHDFLTHKCIIHSLVLGRATEYSQVVNALAPLFHAPTSFNTILVFFVLYPQSYGFFPLFLEDYKLDQDLELSFYFFKLII